MALPGIPAISRGAPKNLRLRDGDRIAIIGAGPAGSLFAHFAHQLAQKMGIAVFITIFDGKTFTQQGPLGCNMCAGVISRTLAARLRDEGIVIPAERVQHKIEGYYLQTLTHGFLLSPPGEKSEITTVFRGNGPRFASPSGNISFDDFLLDHVKAEAAQVIYEPIQDIILPRNPHEPVRLFYGRHHPPQELEAHLVVGAFGLNTAMLQRMTRLGFGYQTPGTVRTCQAELELGREQVQHCFQNNIYTFLLGTDHIRFGVLTPKGSYATISLVGRRDLHTEDLIGFLSHPQVRGKLPPGWQLPPQYCHCFPKLATTPARHPFTHRLVIIGDASFSRYYKNGIESAFITAELAAKTTFYLGVSADAFQEGYLKRARPIIIRDNLYGRFLFTFDERTSRNRLTSEVRQRMVTGKAAGAGLLLRRILWDMFTGDAPYRSILWRSLHPRLLGGILTTSLRIIGEIIRKRIGGLQIER